MFDARSNTAPGTEGFGSQMFVTSTDPSTRDGDKAPPSSPLRRSVRAEDGQRGEAQKPFEKLTFEQVTRHEMDFVRRTLCCLRVPVSEMDDATQEVLLGVHRNLSGFDPAAYPAPDKAIRAWLFRICERAVARALRRIVKRQEVELSEDLPQVGCDGAMIPCEALEREELKRWMHAALAQIPAERAVVVSAYYLHEIPMPAVAATLGIKENTGWNRLRLGLKDLRAACARKRAAESSRSGPRK